MFRDGFREERTGVTKTTTGRNFFLRNDRHG